MLEGVSLPLFGESASDLSWRALISYKLKRYYECAAGDEGTIKAENRSSCAK